ncbi:MAG: MerR family transcriptional regulator [Fibromonadales bacterium]|nr:MerR family transcriptional regulator [Fibromonadales bacterium]
MKYGEVKTEKLYFTSAEAAELVGVSIKVLHSWEKKFPDLKPKKNKAGKRVYNKIDIETAKQIGVGAIPRNSVAPPPEKKLKNTTKIADKDVLLKIRNDLLKNLKRIKRD